MNLQTILTRTENNFGQRLIEWSASRGIATEDFDPRSEELPDGMLLINANQDFIKEDIELHDQFDKKHIPTQKIDINGTLQVAISNFNLWLTSNKCQRVLIIGSDDLLQNENLERFLEKI
ncbi:MAG: hypothetical protein DCO96_11095 [Fluviicola sp. XM-24bin1]|nr:MAG: hypothetical protein DCO96_11095 [Fluviicola sp. XM-24bin1]